MPASRSIEIDESLWPLLTIRYRGITTTPQYAQLLAARSRYLDRHERHLILHDMSQSSNMNSTEQRRLQVEWMKQEDARLRQWVVGIAFVTDSVPLRLLLSVIQHVRPLAMPHAIFPRVSDALPWISAQMRQSGLDTGSLSLLAHFGLEHDRSLG
ncbi:hypothetical protein CYFUS_000715 [Cystobacter fuscus]|uniref:STAS/SEC14 domain-containing protein n=1 Tax=Cystobacter fuscus TaxID=43 RepID=A0A250IVL1_9BACT|nr:hypothetical protein [Cystobacter fuscus]ATB35303.1 hypothetical protein CYFUS_000715 [Cystobacter fuscus]